MTDLSITTTLAATDRPPLVPAAPGGPCRGTKRQWSDAELALLDAYYPDLGPAGLAPYLPARTLPAITEIARKRRLHYHAVYCQQPPATAQLDAAIKRLYRNGVLDNGQMAAFCQQWRRPRQWVRARAILLGVCQPRRGPNTARWKPEEDAILAQYEGKGPRYIQVKLMAAGFTGRTQPAISQRMKYLDLLPRDRTDLWSAHEVGKLLGVEVHVPLGWIRSGKLKAKRALRSDARTVAWEIKRDDLRNFMITWPGEWYPGRCDVYWLVEILAGRVGKA